MHLQNIQFPRNTDAKNEDESYTYRFILKPQEVAEVEISISQCHSGIAFLQIMPCCCHKTPQLLKNKAWTVMTVINVQDAAKAKGSKQTPPNKCFYIYKINNRKVCCAW